MSLINDALKRASSKPPERPDLPLGVPITKADHQSGRGNVLLIVILLLVCAAAAFFWLRPEAAAPVQAKVAPPPAEQKAPAPNPIQRAENVLAKVAERNEVAAPATVEAPAPTPAPPIVAQPTPPPAQPPMAELKLQAIYFRLKDPTAVLNGETVHVGQEVAGVKITAIQRNTVEIEHAGTRRKLTIK